MTKKKKTKNPHAVALGRLGGAVMAKRGPEYYSRMSKARKTHSGPPRKPDSEIKPNSLYQRARRARLKRAGII